MESDLENYDTDSHRSEETAWWEGDSGLPQRDIAGQGQGGCAPPVENFQPFDNEEDKLVAIPGLNMKVKSGRLITTLTVVFILCAVGIVLAVNFSMGITSETQIRDIQRKSARSNGSRRGGGT